MSVPIAQDAVPQQHAHYAKMDTLILHVGFAQQVSMYQIIHLLPVALAQ